METRLDLRLLTRTTRNVAPTPAGEQLAATLRPAFDNIEERLASLDAMRARPAGLVRITTSRSAALSILWPKLSPVLAEYPEIRLELAVEQGLTDIVEHRFDAGVRLGEAIEKDMIAIPIGPEMRMLTVGSPAYFEAHGRPKTPNDLTGHNCINLRLPTLGGLYVWEYEKNGKPLNVRVEGQFLTNDVDLIVEAALDGLGLCCLPDYHLQDLVDAGRLDTVLDDYSPPFDGYHLYYPSRLQASPAFGVIRDALRYRG